MKKTKFILSLSILTLFSACNEASEKTSENKKAETTNPIIEAKEKVAKQNIDSIVMTIDNKRKEIETNLSEPVIVSTEALRAKTKQKWNKIHFYTKNNLVVRIKTYPHENISTRTEEFYLDNGALILAAIEDDGAGERGKAAEEMDKVYYFLNNKIIKEKHTEQKEEHSIKDSDAEELLSELNEYLEIYSNNTEK